MRVVKILCTLSLAMMATGAVGSTAAEGETLLFGSQTVEANIDSVARSAEAFPFVDSTGGTVQSVILYVGSGNKAKTVIAGVYADHNGHPGARLASGSLRSPTAAAWDTVKVTPATITAGNKYWIAVLAKHGTLYFRDGSASSCLSESSSRTKLGSLPSTWTSGPTWSTCPISAYVAGTASIPAPISTAPPQITGTAAQGDTLTTSSGSWSYEPTGYTYVWRDCDISGGNCTSIAGASASSYTLASSDVGHTIIAVVTATNAGGFASSVSSATALVETSTPGAPVNIGGPVVTGTVAVGQKLTVSDGQWTPAPTGFSYQWQDCATDGTGCSNIASAMSSTYAVGSADSGHTVTAVVTAHNANGASSASASPVPLVDEFNGSGVQTSLWTVMNQQGDTTNGELECYLPSRVGESGGFLTETLTAHSVTCPAGTPNSKNPLPYESGAVQMKSVSFSYGTVAVRAKMGSGSNAWPAIWLLGGACQQPNWLTAPGFGCSWPSDALDAAEIDIAEINSASTGPKTVWQNLITGAGTQTCKPTTSDTSANYHTYVLEWTAASVTWKIDGAKTCQFKSNVPLNPMFLIINTAQGSGSLSGNQVTSVDYAHISFGAG